MTEVTIYHNPKCSKSRQTLALLKDQGVEPAVIEYLQNPPDRLTLVGLIGKLGIRPIELMRTQEKPYRELGLAEKQDDDEVLVDAMVSHPILIERPIVVQGQQARLGRPPENVLEIL